MSYDDVWPATGIREEEEENLRQRRELIVDDSLPIGELTDAADEVGIDLADLRFEVVGCIGGTGIRVWEER